MNQPEFNETQPELTNAPSQWQPNDSPQIDFSQLDKRYVWGAIAIVTIFLLLMFMDSSSFRSGMNEYQSAYHELVR